MRRLLRMDQPVPAHTEAEVEAERDRNYRWNFTVNLADVSAFWFGLSFISSATIVPLYISKLTDSTIAIGLAAVISQGAWYLPQLFTANFVEGLARMKPMVVNLGFFLERLPMWFIVLSPVIAVWNPALALFVFLAGIAWHSFGAGIVATSWQDLIARCFPVERRGRFMGTSFFVGAFTGAAAAGFSARLLADFPFPTNFLYSFTIAALAITTSWVFLAMTREPVGQVTKHQQSNRQFWSDLPHILRRDENYRRFLVARLLLALGGMGLGFATVAAVKRWSIADGTVGTYTLTYLLGQMAGNLFTGLLADKRGHKLSLELAALSSFLAFAIAWLAPTEEYYLVVFFLLGIMTGAVLVSGILVVMEFSRPERRPTYIGMTNTSVGVVSMIAPLIGAALAVASYNLLFALSAFLSLLSAAALHWWVREPRFKDLVDSV
jgi:MFS family permease